MAKGRDKQRRRKKKLLKKGIDPSEVKKAKKEAKAKKVANRQKSEG